MEEVEELAMDKTAGSAQAWFSLQAYGIFCFRCRILGCGGRDWE